MITLPGVDPIYMWIGFILLVFIMLAMDLGIFHRKTHAVSIKEALTWAGVWFSLAMVFNIWIYFQFGSEPALNFFTGYLIEKSLSVDNLFVFLLIFTSFSISPQYQHRILFWGILGAIIMRGLFIGVGSALVERFEWVFYIFGVVLLYGAYRMQFNEDKKFNPETSKIVRIVRWIIPVSHQVDGAHFIVKENGKRAITITLLALIVIELTDVVFAFDSIPAIFAITTDPFIVFTSNIFAILGLRSLYFVLADVQGMFEYLKTGLAVILLFIAIKLLIRAFYHIPIVVSLIFIVSVLIISIFASILHHKRRSHREAVHDGKTSSYKPLPPVHNANLSSKRTPHPILTQGIAKSVKKTTKKKKQ